MPVPRHDTHRGHPVYTQFSFGNTLIMRTAKEWNPFSISVFSDSLIIWLNLSLKVKTEYVASRQAHSSIDHFVVNHQVTQSSNATLPIVKVLTGYLHVNYFYYLKQMTVANSSALTMRERVYACIFVFFLMLVIELASETTSKKASYGAGFLCCYLFCGFTQWQHRSVRGSRRNA